MRPTLLFAALIALPACGGASAEVTGSAIGITWGESRWVYYGGPFLAISNAEVDCEGVAWVERNYEAGQAPTDDDVQILQFAFAEDMRDGTFSIGLDASVAATVLEVKDGALTFERAEGGVLTVEAIEEDTSADGTFDGVLFESGTLSGSFTAEWCRNLKE
ncbi:MAG: hypothetical protein ACOZNI_35945 [Myxococcota bacterium]